MKKSIFLILLFSIFAEIAFSDVVFAPSVGISNIVVENANVEILGVNEGSIKNSFNHFKFVCWSPLTMGIGVGTVRKNGFIFMWDNYFSLLSFALLDGEINSYSLQAMYLDAKPSTLSATKFAKDELFAKSGFLYQTHFMFGYSFHPADKMYFNLTAGLGLGIGKFNLKFSEISSLKIMQLENIQQDALALFSVGGTVQFEFQYYFNKNVGLNVGIFDTMGFTRILLAPEVTVSYLNTAGSSTFVSDKKRIMISAKSFANNFSLKIGPVIKIGK